MREIAPPERSLSPITIGVDERKGALKFVRRLKFVRLVEKSGMRLVVVPFEEKRRFPRNR